VKNRHEIRGDVAVVFIVYRGDTFEMMLDAEDLPLVEPYTWRLNKGRSTPYAVAGVKQKTWAHKLIALGPDGDRFVKVDHKNFNGLDNRKANLEGVDHSLNARRTRDYRHNTSGHRGVSFDTQSGKWKAQITVAGVKKHLGYFEHQGDAVIAVGAEMEKLGAIVEPASAEDYERAAEAQAIAKSMGGNGEREQAG
jgi:hypothetical protein